MIRNLFTAFTFIVLLASCSTTRPTGSANRQINTTPAAKPLPAGNKKSDIKFLDEITANPQLSASIPDTKTERKQPMPDVADTRIAPASSSIENASSLQIKYAQLLNTNVEQVETTDLLKSVDHWYGTRYRMGGTSKSGIDCSAFVQAVYLTAFGLTVPRTAFEQYRAANHISATEMKEGDLVFFNTTGGVSHVGIYLLNNKFIHASSSKGVTVSDLFDPYYLKRFLGVGRFERPMGTR